MSARPYAKFLMLAFGLCALSLMPGGHKAQASAPAGRYAYPDGSVSSSGTVYDTFTHLDSILKGVDEGKGSLGQFVKNRSFYDHADETMDQAQQLVKGFRENPKKYLTINMKIF